MGNQKRKSIGQVLDSTDKTSDDYYVFNPRLLDRYINTPHLFINDTDIYKCIMIIHRSDDDDKCEYEYTLSGLNGHLPSMTLSTLRRPVYRHYYVYESVEDILDMIQRAISARVDSLKTQINALEQKSINLKGTCNDKIINS